jgi:Conserved hypothetical protein 2217 (DUF2460)
VTWATFPTLAGQGISVHKSPRWATAVAVHASGRESRARHYLLPAWDFELTFDGLDATASGSYGGLGAASLQILGGFFLQRQGQYQPFFFIDPSDSVAVNQRIGTGNGVTTTFTLGRSLGAYFLPVDAIVNVTGVPPEAGPTRRPIRSRFPPRRRLGPW